MQRNTATQPAAAASSGIAEREYAQIFARHYLAAIKTASLMDKEADRAHKQRRSEEVKLAYSAAYNALKERVNASLKTAAHFGGLLFCWEGSSVMHTAVPE